eukprot:CAMPEP_0177379778 /NCGR_PEP_ID=MMETSP0368-20130122/47129_1 /TAXON_ID=447022 ORGANISM="Scrippsiella hangoei-like, Strain SHHI-4" /NCGR_SAMPLE_ID=MMETSP0368 /ASSEMBLY_ACC=CAM_ASM_000363 /LENGTH=105 /DNA_ID=CAMNT_0018843977 /DNA_START=20 /DNA_END=338 /DNA_ORIENTATION=-
MGSAASPAVESCIAIGGLEAEGPSKQDGASADHERDLIGDLKRKTLPTNLGGEWRQEKSLAIVHAMSEMFGAKSFETCQEEAAAQVLDSTTGEVGARAGLAQRKA